LLAGNLRDIDRECGNCQVGCGHNAKNKVTTNYLYLAGKAWR
jgi:cholesterol oxidase